MRVVITGGSGFVGSYLCEEFLKQGWQVICIDNMASGRIDNVRHLEGKDFSLRINDVIEEMPVEENEPVDLVLHLASIASPERYTDSPIETLRVGAEGTLRALLLAEKNSAKFLLASTSEVYGEAKVHPQVEGYYGNVNPIGVRSCYDESKRYAEALTMAFQRVYGTDTRIVRIFNTYGKRMLNDDGRVITNFIRQARRGEPLTVYGKGTQTRSFMFIDDLVAGIMAVLKGEIRTPVNLGNPEEITILDLANKVKTLLNSNSEIVFKPMMENDPKQRRPDITLAKERLGWLPHVKIDEGLRRMI